MKRLEKPTWKNGGTGKGQAICQGLNLNKFGENLEATKGTRKDKCLDCMFFKGINPIDIVTCDPQQNKHKGLEICECFAKEVK